MDEKQSNKSTSKRLPNPSADLFVKIMNRIDVERRRISIRRRFTIFSVGLIGSLIALTPVFKMMQKGFVESGFTKFFSLIFSDSAAILSYWHEFILILLESLPVVSILAFLAIILVFLGSLKFVIQDAKIIFKHKLVNN
jgi:hypothetical protein